jgi:hypothetical protein
MSSSNTIANNFTTTSSSSNHCSNKQDVENTVVLDSNIVSSTEETISSNVSDKTETTETTEKAPVLNIWQLRQQVEQAANALKASTELNTNLMEQLTKQLETDTDTNNYSSDGYKLVQRKRYPKKPFHKNKQFTNTNTSVITSPTNTATQTEPKKVYVKNFNNKSAEDFAYRERRRKALDDAQNIVIAECVDLLNGKRNEINTEIEFTKNYHRKYILWCSSDDVCVDIEGEKFVFSRFQYLENRYFQRKVRDCVATLIPDAWINFSPRRDSACCCIYVQKRKEQTYYKASTA